MLSVGSQELAVFGVVLLFLIVFGSAKFSRTARNVGQLIGGTKRTVEEAKADLIPEEVKEAQDAIKDLKSEALYGGEQEQRAPQTLAPPAEAPSLTPHAIFACSPL